MSATHRSRAKIRVTMLPENISPPAAIAGPANLWVEKRGCMDTRSSASPLKTYRKSKSIASSLNENNDILSMDREAR